MDGKQPEEGSPQLDSLLEALGAEGADSLLAEMLAAEGSPAEQVATKPGEIRSRVKEMAARNPELIIKIINHWINEDRRRGKPG